MTFKPTAVLDLDVAALPPRLCELERFGSALAVLRWRGRVVGQAFFDLHASELDQETLLGLLLQHAGTSFWEAWLRDHLGLGDAYPPAPVSARVSVAICTRDRTEDLERCLTALAALPQDGQQICVVDNAPSSDATRQLVKRFPNVTYVLEARPGLDVARNRAFQATEGEIIAFTDDDAVPDPMWLRNLLGHFSDPLVMASTGLTMALELEHEAQVKFQSYGGFTRGFKTTVFDGGSHEPLLGWHAGAGVSMAVRRSLLDLVGQFDEALDAGTPTRAGGDSDMFRRILAAGYRIVYDPAALSWHRHRRTEEELTTQLVGYEIAAGALLGKALLRDRNLSTLPHGWRLLRRRSRSTLAAAVRRRWPDMFMHVDCLRGLLGGPLHYLKSARAAERT